MGRDYWEQQNQESEEQVSNILDCNGAPLNDGDSVTLIKDLKVKGAGQTLKRGTMVKNIRINPDKPEEIDCSTKDIKGLVLKTCFVKKA